MDYAYRHALKSISIEIKIRGANDGSQVGENMRKHAVFLNSFHILRQIGLYQDGYAFDLGASGLLEELLPAIWLNEDFLDQRFARRQVVNRRQGNVGFET